MGKTQKLKSIKGITLITLVVTIIVLIILAGVSINMVLGENGIITMAKKAKENMQLATEEEQMGLNNLFEQVKNEESSITGNKLEKEYAEFRKIIAEAITNKGIETNETDSAETMAENISKLETEIDLEKLTQATADAGDISNGKTAWVNGVLITGLRAAPISQLSGSVSVPLISKGSTYSANVTFSTPFDIVPKVTGYCTGTTTAQTNFSISFSNITRTGFSFTVRNNNSQGYDPTTVKWVASAY